jgi:hypothetical protein
MVAVFGVAIGALVMPSGHQDNPSAPAVSRREAGHDLLGRRDRPGRVRTGPAGEGSRALCGDTTSSSRPAVRARFWSDEVKSAKIGLLYWAPAMQLPRAEELRSEILELKGNVGNDAANRSGKWNAP